MRSKVTPRKVGVGLKRRRELSKRRLAWWGSIEKKKASYLLGLRGRHQYRYSDQSFLCSLYCSGNLGGSGPNDQIVIAKRAADGRGQRRREIIDEEREKCRTKNGSFQNIWMDSKGATFVILKNYANLPIRKKGLRQRTKQGGTMEASRNKFMEKGGVLDRVESSGEVDGSEYGMFHYIA